MRTMLYDTIIFDFDGTLADTAEDVWEAIEYAAGKVGSSIPGDIRENCSNLGFSKREIFDKLEPRVPDHKFKIFETEIIRYYQSISAYENTDFYPGIENLLKDLNDREIPCYIITRKSMIPLERILSLKGWKQYFKGWFSPDSIPGKTKIKSEMLHSLLENLGYESVSVYIGDTYTDIIAARENSVDCIACLYGDGDAECLKAFDPDYVVENPEELREILFRNSVKG